MRPETNEPAAERFARVRPPAGHASRVAARSGPRSHPNSGIADRAAVLPWRWVLPAAASVALVIGAVWQSDRASRQLLFDAPGRAPHWSGKGVDTPVLPPRAYWEMSPFEEFAQLGGSMPVPSREPPAGTTDTPLSVQGLRIVKDWASLPTLPIIVIEDITPAPIELQDIAELAPIALAPIYITPIDIGSGDQEER